MTESSNSENYDIADSPTIEEMRSLTIKCLKHIHKNNLNNQMYKLLGSGVWVVYYISIPHIQNDITGNDTPKLVYVPNSSARSYTSDLSLLETLNNGYNPENEVHIVIAYSYCTGELLYPMLYSYYTSYILGGCTSDDNLKINYENKSYAIPLN
jgi:hypothetical protein